MADGRNRSLEEHFEGIADELLHLAYTCDVRLSDEGTIERIIRNDESVCGRRNADAFRQLHNLLIAYYHSLCCTINRIGPQEMKNILNALSGRNIVLPESAGQQRASALRASGS